MVSAWLSFSGFWGLYFLLLCVMVANQSISPHTLHCLQCVNIIPYELFTNVYDSCVTANGGMITWNMACFIEFIIAEMGIRIGLFFHEELHVFNIVFSYLCGKALHLHWVFVLSQEWKIWGYVVTQGSNNAEISWRDWEKYGFNYFPLTLVYFTANWMQTQK